MVLKLSGSRRTALKSGIKRTTRKNGELACGIIGYVCLFLIKSVYMCLNFICLFRKFRVRYHITRKMKNVLMLFLLVLYDPGGEGETGKSLKNISSACASQYIIDNFDFEIRTG